MASKLIVTRQQLTAALHAAFEAFAGETSPVLGERIAPFLGDEDPGFDFEALQGVLARMLAASIDRLVAADMAHADELVRDVMPRYERDRQVKAVRAKLIDIRCIVAGLFGLNRAREIVAVDGATAEQPELLWRQARATLGRLRDPELRLPPASTGAVSFDAAVLADELEPLVTALRESIDGCAADVHEAALTLQVKKEAMAEHDRLTSACGRILSGFCLLADRPDLARRVRVTPSRGRRRRSSAADRDEPPAVSITDRQRRPQPSPPTPTGSASGEGPHDRGRTGDRFDLLDDAVDAHLECVVGDLSRNRDHPEEHDGDVPIRRRRNVPQGRTTRTTDL